jgi:hypothetical protein
VAAEVAERPTSEVVVVVVGTPEAVVVEVPEAEVVAEDPPAASGHSPDIVQADA